MPANPRKSIQTSLELEFDVYEIHFYIRLEIVWNHLTPIFRTLYYTILQSVSNQTGNCKLQKCLVCSLQFRDRSHIVLITWYLRIFDVLVYHDACHS